MLQYPTFKIGDKVRYSQYGLDVWERYFPADMLNKMRKNVFQINEMSTNNYNNKIILKAANTKTGEKIIMEDLKFYELVEKQIKSHNHPLTKIFV